HAFELLAHRRKLVDGELPHGDAGLIADDDQGQPKRCQARQALERTGRETHPGGVDVVGDVSQQGAVLVQKKRSVQGHDVSFIGSTITSGITVSGGCVSTKRMARATFIGSCKRFSSMSGNRSSKNGVRMPPAMTADTLTPVPRNSA